MESESRNLSFWLILFLNKQFKLHPLHSNAKICKIISDIYQHKKPSPPFKNISIIHDAPLTFLLIYQHKDQLK